MSSSVSQGHKSTLLRTQVNSTQHALWLSFRSTLPCPYQHPKKVMPASLRCFTIFPVSWGAAVAHRQPFQLLRQSWASTCIAFTQTLVKLLHWILVLALIFCLVNKAGNGDSMALLGQVSFRYLLTKLLKMPSRVFWYCQSVICTNGDAISDIFNRTRY